MSVAEVAETVFPAVPESVGAARRFTLAALRRHDIAPDTIDTAILLVSELATNALLHAESQIRIRVRVTDEIRIEVGDLSSEAPAVSTGDTHRESGRGMELVANLASGWDWDPRPDGKIVWFAVSRD